MVCPCVSELKRFLSGGSCTALMIYSFLHATGVFNLVCALHAAADISDVESDQCGLRGWLVTTWEPFFRLPGRHSPLREYPRAEIWQSVAENPFSHAEDRMARNHHVVLLG